MTGLQVKQLILTSGVKCWQVADGLGMSDGNFSRRLRREFNEQEVDKIKVIISDIKKQVSA